MRPVAPPQVVPGEFRNAEPAERPTPVRGRFAPSPTGLLHIGSARTALAAWLSIRQQGGVFIWRVEDLDTPRVVPGTIEAAMEDLLWLGLDWDEGPLPHDATRSIGPHAPYSQSGRAEFYEAALARLAAAGDLFPCSHSRKDLLSLASAPHGDDGLPPYPPALRPARLAPGWFQNYCASPSPDAALRFRVRNEPVHFVDRYLGPRTEDVATSTGDFVLKRRDGVYAYQLAVVVDDIEMGITEVVRGQDLLDSTGRQIQLFEALGAQPPEFAHVPLALNPAGEKLSKRDEGLTLASLRAEGVPPEAVVGYLAHTLGMVEAPRPVPLLALVERFAWDRVPPGPLDVPNDLARRLRHLR